MEKLEQEQADREYYYYDDEGSGEVEYDGSGYDEIVGSGDDQCRLCTEEEMEEEEEEEGFHVVREPLHVRQVSSTVENVCPTQQLALKENAPSLHFRFSYIQVETHRLVLALVSPVLRTLLYNHPQPPSITLVCILFPSYLFFFGPKVRE